MFDLTKSSHFSTISQAILLLKAQVDEQSQHELTKFELISIKLKLIEEQTQESRRGLQQYCNS